MTNVLAVTEDRLARTSKRSLFGGTEYTRIYFVEFDAETGPHFCYNAVVSDGGSIQVPDIGHAHPDNGFATVRDIAPALQEGSDRHYRVAVRYSSGVEGETPLIENPLEEPAQFRWRRESKEREYAWSWPLPQTAMMQLPPGIALDPDTGKFPVLKSNLRPFDPSRTKQYSSDVFSVTWNSQTPVPFELRNHKDVVNESPFTIMNDTGTPLTFLGGTCLLTEVSADFLKRSDIHYWRTTIEFAFRPYQHHQQYKFLGKLMHISGWDDLVEAWGFLAFDSPVVGTRKIKQILIGTPDGGEAEPAEPLALNISGQWIGAPGMGQVGAIQFVHWLRPYKRMDFNTIGMP